MRLDPYVGQLILSASVRPGGVTAHARIVVRDQLLVGTTQKVLMLCHGKRILQDSLTNQAAVATIARKAALTSTVPTAILTKMHAAPLSQISSRMPAKPVKSATAVPLVCISKLRMVSSSDAPILRTILAWTAKVLPTHLLAGHWHGKNKTLAKHQRPLNTVRGSARMQAFAATIRVLVQTSICRARKHA